MASPGIEVKTSINLDGILLESFFIVWFVVGIFVEAVPGESSTICWIAQDLGQTSGWGARNVSKVLTLDNIRPDTSIDGQVKLDTHADTCLLGPNFVLSLVRQIEFRKVQEIIHEGFCLWCDGLNVAKYKRP